MILLHGIFLANGLSGVTSIMRFIFFLMVITFMLINVFLSKEWNYFLDRIPTSHLLFTTVLKGKSSVKNEKRNDE